MKALRDLYEWRDKIARETDESCEYVLKNHHLLKIAELLPREIYGILALCNPLSSVVETNVHEILEVIKQAREFAGTLTVLSTDANRTDGNLEESKVQGSKESQSKSVLESIAHLAAYDPDSAINCAHDFPQDIDSEMNIDQQSDTTVRLAHIFLKPSSSDSELPDNLIEQSVSVLTSLFNKSHVQRTKGQNKKLQTLEDKVKAIKVILKMRFGQTYAPKKTKGLSLGFQFFEYLGFELGFEYFANILQIFIIII
jgi:ribonuclease D